MAPSSLRVAKDSVYDMQRSDALVSIAWRRDPNHYDCVEVAFVAFPSFFARTSLWYFCTATDESRLRLEYIPGETMQNTGG